MSDMLDTAIKAAKDAGRLVRDAFYDKASLGSEFKQENDILQVVTRIDVDAERIILQVLKERFPEHAFFSEEAGGSGMQSDYQWIIDPIDGTSNYARRIPFFCISIGLTYKNEPVLGVIYQPVTDELFSAEKGAGAYLNATKISVTEAQDVGQAFVTVDRGKSRREKDRFVTIVAALTKHVRSMRMPGSGALQTCYVACGKFDAAVFNGLSFYDIAAASVIAREAGAELSDFSAKAWELRTGDVLVCGRGLQRPLADILQAL